jgi:hypothetical protein
MQVEGLVVLKIKMSNYQKSTSSSATLLSQALTISYWSMKNFMHSVVWVFRKNDLNFLIAIGIIAIGL